MKAILKFFVSVGFLIGADVAGAEPSPGRPAAPAGDKEIVNPLVGDYAIVSGEKNGKAIESEKIKGSLVAFSATAITGTDKDKKEFFACSYALERKAMPWTIRMKSTSPKGGDEAVGLVKKEGDTLTVIYALPGGEAPTEFKTKAKQHMFVMRGASADKPNKGTTLVPPSGK